MSLPPSAPTPPSQRGAPWLPPPAGARWPSSQQGGPWPPPQPIRLLPKPPLSPRQRTRTLVAGGIAFTLIGGGGSALALYLMAAAALAFFAGTWQLALGAGDEFGEMMGALVYGGALYSGIFCVTFGLGYGASLLILRSGGVHRPNSTTLLASLIALTAWSAVGGIFVMVYLMAAPKSQPWEETPAAAGSFLTVFICALALITCAAVGAVSWWLTAHLLRPRSVPPPGR